MSRHVSRKERWWKSDTVPSGGYRSAEGFVFPKKGRWVAVVFVPKGQRAVGDYKRTREAQMAVEDAATMMARGRKPRR